MPINDRRFKNKYLNWFFTSKMVDGFFFSVLCATIFSFVVCHWLLDINYKYTDYGANFPGPVVDLHWVFWGCAVVSLYYLIKKRTIQFDFALVILCQTMVLIGVHDYHYEDYLHVCYAWILPMAYIVGKLAVYSDDYENVQRRITALYLTLIISTFITAFLDYSYVFGIYDEYKAYGAAWPSFLLKEEYISRTTYDYGFVLAGAATVYAVFMLKKNKKIAIPLLILAFIPQLFSVKYEARLMTCMVVVCVGVCMLLCAYEYRISPITKKIVTWLVMAVIIFVIIGALIFHFNILGIHDIYDNSYWSDDGGIIKNIRFQLDWNALQNIIKYPLEDFQEVYGLPRGHSMLLEYGRVYDLSIYLLLIVFRIVVIMDCVRIAFDNRIDITMKCLLVPAFVLLNIYYSMEPNAHAHRYFLMLGLIVFGINRSLVERKVTAWQR